MNTKKYLIVAGLSAALLAGAASLAFAAKPLTHMNKGVGSDMHPNMMAQKMVVQIGPNGNALLRGTIKTVTPTLMVTSWGGDWAVNVSSDTKLMPEGGLSTFKVGDFVGVQGVAGTGAWTIDAKLVRDWTQQAMPKSSKASFTFTNNTGAQTNDLHIVFNTAVDVTATGSLPTLSDNNTNSPTLSGGTVAAAGTSSVSVTGQANKTEIKKWWWTLNGTQVGATHEGCEKPDCTTP